MRDYQSSFHWLRGIANMKGHNYTSKEDMRNVCNIRIDLVQELECYGCRGWVHDPLVSREALEQLGVRMVEDPFQDDRRYDAVVLAVPHTVFRERAAEEYLSLL